MRQAVGRFRPQLVGNDGCWTVVIHADRSGDRLILDALAFAQELLEEARLPTATVRFLDRSYRLHAGMRFDAFTTRATLPAKPRAFVALPLWESQVSRG